MDSVEPTCPIAVPDWIGIRDQKQPQVKPPILDLFAQAFMKIEVAHEFVPFLCCVASGEIAEMRK